MALEVGADFVGVVEGFEGVVALEGPEEGAGEAFVAVWEGDHHGLAAWPDVEGGGVEGEAAEAVGVGGAGGELCGRGDVEFFVAVVEVGLLVVVTVGSLHDAADGGEGAVGGDQEVALGGGEGAVGRAEGGGAGERVGVDAGGLEDEADVGVGGGFIDEGEVEAGAGDGVDGVGGVGGVGLIGEVAGVGVHHASLHGEGILLHDALVEADRAEGVESAVGEGEVDGAAAGVSGGAWVGASFVELDLEAQSGEGAGEEAPGEAGADDDDFLAGAYGHGDGVEVRRRRSGFAENCRGTDWARGGK